MKIGILSGSLLDEVGSSAALESRIDFRCAVSLW